MPWRYPPPPVKVSKTDIARIVRAMKKEFPEDWALQQVHIARKILNKEAELAGMDDWEYHKYLSNGKRWVGPEKKRKS